MSWRWRWDLVEGSSKKRRLVMLGGGGGGGGYSAPTLASNLIMRLKNYLKKYYVREKIMNKFDTKTRKNIK
jgi:hypothetical protein